MENLGFAYLIHLDQKFKHCGHYIGFSKAHPRGRLERHIAGQGSRFLRAVDRSSISFQLARVWGNVDRHFERKLKNRKNSKFLCPLCLPGKKTAIIGG